jgi:hypothetical protein
VAAHRRAGARRAPGGDPGFDERPGARRGIASRGGKVVAISTADGTATSTEGFDEGDRRVG